MAQGECMDRRAGRVVVDVTDWNAFLASGAPISGIQRVTLNLLRSLRRLKRPFLIIRYDTIQRRHREVEPVFLDQDFSLPRDPAKRGKAPRGSRYAHPGAKAAIEAIRFRLLQTCRRHDVIELDCFGPAYAPRDGDILYLAGAGWDCAPTMDAVNRFKKMAKVRFVVEIFDLIPLNESVYHDRIGRRQFKRWLAETGGLTDLYVCLSDHTERDFVHFRDRLGISGAIPTIVITPPHEFTPSDGFDADLALGEKRQKRYALCVAQVFNHKNGRRVIEAWSALNLVSDPPVEFVIAGATPEAEIRRVFGAVPGLRVIERPTDTMLANLYKNAEFTVFPSLYEGWGMPVGESLWCGTPCLASNCASIPEVGADMCDYFDPRQAGELEGLIARAMFDPVFLTERIARLERRRLKSLDQYAAELHEALMAGGGGRQSPAALTSKTSASPSAPA